jgi:hypothetical protein
MIAAYRLAASKMISGDYYVTMYTGHGRVSMTPIGDIDSAIANAQKLLESSIRSGPEIFYQKAEEIDGYARRIRKQKVKVFKLVIQGEQFALGGLQSLANDKARGTKIIHPT